MNEAHSSLRIENVSPVKKKLSFEIPWEEMKVEREDVLRQLGKSARVKGFRPGKVPRPILERQYSDYIKEETINNVVNRFYWEAVKANNISPLSQPEIEPGAFEPEMPFSFMATVEVEPVIEPKDYLGLKLAKASVAVTDEEVENRLQAIREMYATMEEVMEERPVMTGDFVSLSFEGWVDGTPREDLKADDYLLACGAETFVPGFEEQIVGMRKGEEKDITVTFPPDYRNREVAGKEVLFHVKVRGIKEKKLPPFDEEFVKNFERYETLADLKTDIRAAIEKEKAERARVALKDVIVDQLLAKNEVPAPETLVERQVFYMMMDSHRYWTMRGMDANGAAELIMGMKEMYREEAEKMVKTLLLLKRIAEKEGISVSEEELTSYFDELARRRGQDVESYRQMVEKEGLRERIELDMLTQKVIDFIESNSEIGEEGIEVKE